GGFDGPGRLPYAVASFFEQGGRRAYVVRIVPDDAGAGRGDGVASGVLRPLAAAGGEVRLWARSEGSWGDGLSAELTFDPAPLPVTMLGAADMVVPSDAPPPVGSLLRLRLADTTRVLAWVIGSRVEGDPAAPGRRRVVTLDAAPAQDVTAAELVEATLTIDDGDGRVETHARLGLDPGHPRALARVLMEESDLVEPDPAWWDATVRPGGPGAALGPAVTWSAPAADVPVPGPRAGGFAGGSDRWAAIQPSDFFDARWVPGDEEPRSGVHALVDVDDVALVAVPDLYEPAPLAEPESIADVSLAGPEFRECVDLPPPRPQAPPPPGLDGLALDPTVGASRATIVGLQLRLVELADLLRSWIVLLDVPPGLGPSGALKWRASFDSAWAAAFHPWLRVARPDDRRGGAVEVNPSALAAGIAARRALRDGVQYGPANELAARVVDVRERVDPAAHADLHPAGINVFLREPDGVRLSAARTLARDPQWRQLSVRRLVSMLERALQHELDWVVFEPNTASLRADVDHLIRAYLRRLYRANAFVGAGEDEAFFVRCDDTLNPAPVVDAGQLVAEIGVAPAEPLEFIVLRLARGGDGTLLVEAAR
ncbi:MAG: uncharacterized protein QOJ07_3051, partial [Thermoleophilaceae bacterium]|nr:uncharacterized protein [Thermoleophilaceae bacterium]